MNAEIRELTPPGRGAVTVLRLRGEGASARIRELCGVDPTPGSPRRVRLRLAGEELDEAILCRLPSGDLEIHVHGSPPLARRLIEAFGARDEPRSFVRSLEARAADLLSRAPCEAGARILLDQAEGALSRELASLPALEAEERERRIETLLARWRAARFAIEPAVVVLAGPVNAGKSTLFNALLGESRAIVDAEPGTTRDLLRAPARFGEWPVLLCDSAGERDPDAAPASAAVELEGQDRGRRALQGADLVLWLEPIVPGRAPSWDAPARAGERAALVLTFADRLGQASTSRSAISGLRDPAGARSFVARLFRETLELPADPWRPGEGVPIARDVASAIDALRGHSGVELERRIEAIVAPDPRSGFPWPVAPNAHVS